MDTQSLQIVQDAKTNGLRVGEVAPLTFAAVDSIAFAAVKGRLSSLSSIRLSASSLGPLVELLSLSRDGLLPDLGSLPCIDLSSVSEFYAAYRQNQKLWICPFKRRGFLKAGEKHDETASFRFCSAAQRAATIAGFGRGAALQLAAALVEMLDNIDLHSKRPATGVAAFDADARRFQFVIADGGIRILRSLKECNEYSELSDHGDALQVALTDGCSRYGRGSNHGRGFSPLFVGLSNLNGSLRFRSGDHALTIDGKDPKNIPWTKNAKPPIGGFLASVCIKM